MVLERDPNRTNKPIKAAIDSAEIGKAPTADAVSAAPTNKSRNGHSSRSPIPAKVNNGARGKAALPGRSGRFAKLSVSAIFDLRLTPPELRVLAALSSYIDSASQCYPSIKRIAERLSTDERHVRRRLRQLERAGYIEIELGAGIGRRGRATNTYLLCYPDVPIGGLKASQAQASEEAGISPSELSTEGLVTAPSDSYFRGQEPPGDSGQELPGNRGQQLPPKLDQLTRPLNYPTRELAAVDKQSPIAQLRPEANWEDLVQHTVIVGHIERGEAMKWLLKAPNIELDDLLRREGARTLSDRDLAQWLARAEEQNVPKSDEEE